MATSAYSVMNDPRRRRPGDPLIAAPAAAPLPVAPAVNNPAMTGLLATAPTSMIAGTTPAPVIPGTVTPPPIALPGDRHVRPVRDPRPERNPPPPGTLPSPGAVPPGPGMPPAPVTPPLPLAQTAANSVGPAPISADASVVTQLNGLLASDSPYMQLARAAGERSAARRGLQNSSIAAGSSEASAIAAAAPIASQDASQIHQRNQTAFESWNQYRNATGLQSQQDKSAMERLTAELTSRLQLQGMGDTSAMARLIAEGDIQKAVATMQQSGELTRTQISANVSLIDNYMSSFATIAANEKIPAAARNAYLNQFLQTMQSGQGLVNALSGMTVTWPGAPPTTTTTPPGTTPPRLPGITPLPTGAGTGTTRPGTGFNTSTPPPFPGFGGVLGGYSGGGYSTGTIRAA